MSKSCLYGTHLENDIFRCFFRFFKSLIFRVVSGVKGQNMVQIDKKIMSVVLGISGTVHHMIVIYGTGGERAKNSPKWQKILSITLHISGTMHLMTVIYGTHLQNDNVSRRFCFFSPFFQHFDFLGP